MTGATLSSLMITYLRTRQADSISQLGAATRRREGTTAVEVADPSGVPEALAGGVLVSITSPEGNAPAYVVDAAAALELEDVAGWRITVSDGDDQDQVLDALARTQAAFLRTARSDVARAARLCSLPDLVAQVSVFVNSVEEAVEAVGAGATDLLLRDWDTERLGELRAALAGRLVERTVFPPGVDFDDLHAELDPDALTAYMHLVDASGVVRPHHDWAPGMSTEPPVPPHRLSLEWTDEAWRNSTPGEPSDRVARILERARDGIRPSTDEMATLLAARGDDVDAIAACADELRRAVNGEAVTYVVNRNINYTNQCYFRCGFCAFSKGPRSLNLRGDPYLLDLEEIVARTVEAAERGATEVTLQGGIHPSFTGQFYLDVVEAIKARVPEMHIHGFTPLEVWQGAETMGTDVRTFLTMLRDAGLGTLPGTAAEILDDQVRKTLCPDKIRTSQWSYVMRTAHELGLQATATIMFGHIDHPANWANHFEAIRRIQVETGGFTEVVPLPFVHMGAPIYLNGTARPGPTWDEVVLVHAVARIAFHGLIDNIQASWVKLGSRGAARLLDAGCNDVGGTLINENISRAAGADHGQEMTAEELEGLILGAGRAPLRRNTLYQPVG